jgi:hypothetical protein
MFLHYLPSRDYFVEARLAGSEGQGLNYFGIRSEELFSRRDPAVEESDIQVDTPKRGSTHRISAK